MRSGILLVGGSGFLGLALARALVAAGREVHVVSRNVAPGCREGITFHRGGQEDVAAIAPLLSICNNIVHLASTTTPGSSARHPAVDVLENLLPAVRFMEIMAGFPPERLIFVSSGGAIYGNPDRLPADESQIPSPLSNHAAGKVALEAFFSSFAHAHGISFATLRPSNLYGPGQGLRHGFGLVRTLLERALHSEAIEVWGDGNAVRDYLYIDDVVEACSLLLDAPHATGAYNAGSGTGVSILELIALVEKVTGHAIAVASRPTRGTDVRAIVLGSTRLRHATGWVPRTSLEDGLKRTWEWVRSRESRRGYV